MLINRKPMNTQAIKIAACATCLLLSLSTPTLAEIDKGHDGQARPDETVNPVRYQNLVHI